MNNLVNIYKNKKLLILIIVTIVIRVITNSLEYSPDALSFTIWAKYLSQNSLSDLYKYLPGGYLPYPPLYYYILLPFGYLISFLGLNTNSWLALLIVKIPVIFSDLAVGLLVYNAATQWFEKSAGLAAATYYLLNPVIVYNTSIWGQIDSIIILMGWLCLREFSRQNFFNGWIWLLLGSLIKLQMFTLLPIALTLTFNKLPIRKMIKYIISLCTIALLPFIPIIVNNGVFSTLLYFINLPNQYPYTSVYSFNIWAPLGFLVSDKLKLFGITEIRYLGILFFWVVSIWITFPFLNKKKILLPKLFFAAFLLWFAFALFPTRIHSRYLIYSFGFIAPFVSRFPKIAATLTILMVANLLLPNKSSILSPLVILLNSPIIIACMVIFAVCVFIMGCINYISIEA